MHLEMKTQCEKCGAALAVDGKAYICSYECTFCPACALNMQGTCPNCGGELIRRPVRKNLNAGTQNNAQNSGLRIPAIKTWLIWVISFAVWTFIALAGTASIYELYRSMGNPMSFFNTLGLEFSQILTYAPLTPFVFVLAVRYPVQRANWIRRCLWYLAGGLVFSMAHVILRGLTPYGVWDSQARAWVSAIWDSHAHAFRVEWRTFEMLFFRNVVDDITGTYVPIVLIAHAVLYYRRFRDRELRASELQTQLAKNRLQALKSQLQPHFLFNTLHSISALMLTDVRAADRMMTRLSDLLRMSLENDALQITTLSRELEFVTAYLEIEKVRFGERLSIVLDIPSDTLDAQIPHLLLQPLVENAVRHGISRRSSEGEIQISSKHDERELYLRIKDNGPGIHTAEGRSGRDGLGLRTTRERLRTLYGDDHDLDIRSTPGCGLEVEIRLPFRVEGRPLIYELESKPAEPAL